MTTTTKKDLKIVILIIGFILALVGAFIAGGYAGYDQRVEQQKAEASKVSKPLDAYTIYNLVNAERVKAGLKPLLLDPNLVATAQARADDMVARNYFSHFDPVDGHKLINDKTGLGGQKQCLYASENISEKWSTEQEAVGGWMGSKPHHDAILDERYTSTGVAVSGDKAVQHFCQTK